MCQWNLPIEPSRDPYVKYSLYGGLRLGTTQREVGLASTQRRRGNGRDIHDALDNGNPSEASHRREKKGEEKQKEEEEEGKGDGRMTCGSLCDFGNVNRETVEVHTYRKDTPTQRHAYLTASPSLRGFELFSALAFSVTGGRTARQPAQWRRFTGEGEGARLPTCTTVSTARARGASEAKRRSKRQSNPHLLTVHLLESLFADSRIAG
uniref:Uncharacterized protein n=1 Tax=Oryza glumipatula TaxID=40148 RepID=A0A0E0AKW7_9ORYZ